MTLWPWSSSTSTSPSAFDNGRRPENLNSWPTTFFLDRDGRVRGVHAGFAGRASGDFYTQTRHEVTELVERLLAELDTLQVVETMERETGIEPATNSLEG